MRPLVRTLLVFLPLTAAFVLLAPQAPLGSTLWPAPNHDASPEGGVRAGFMAMGLLQALASAAGITYLILGWRISREVSGGGAVWTALFHASLGWMLANWWLHDSLHYLNGLDMAGLLAIDVVFHGSLIGGAAVILIGLSRGAHPLDVQEPAVRGIGTGRRTP